MESDELAMNMSTALLCEKRQMTEMGYVNNSTTYKLAGIFLMFFSESVMAEARSCVRFWVLYTKQRGLFGNISVYKDRSKKYGLWEMIEKIGII